MAKSREPMEMPKREDYQTEEAYWAAYGKYKASFDDSPVTDFRDLDIQFTANGKPIPTPSMANFSKDLKKAIEGVVRTGVEIVLNSPDADVSAKVYENGEQTGHVSVDWVTQPKDYERMLPDGYPVKSFSSDFYDMGRLLELERLARAV